MCGAEILQPQTNGAATAGQLSRQLGEDLDDFFGLPGAYNQLTAAAVQDAARRWLDTGNYVRVTLLPEKAAETAPKADGRVLRPAA